jgi:ATP/maltotriose-dependent transcriptional regulator MalT
VHVWRALGHGVANFRGRWDDWAEASEHALRHARLAAQPSADLFGLELALASGSLAANEALRALDTLLPENPHPGLLLCRAWLLAMLSRVEEASQLASEAGQRYRELTGDDWGDWLPAQIAALSGDHEAAASYLRGLCDLLQERDQRFYLAAVAPMLGRELCALGRHGEAERFAELARELDVPQHALAQASLRQVQALVHASRGEHTEAEALAREAVALIERTDGLNWQGDALCDLAEVLHAAGQSDDARAALAQALARYERKKNLAMAAQVRDRLAELQDAAPR